jgi:hypothetical protein
LIFQQVRKTGKRNRGSSVDERFVSHSFPVPTLSESRACVIERAEHASHVVASLSSVLIPLEPKAHT